MNKDTLKQVLDAMRLHTAETHPLVETERAMEMIEAELAQPEPVRREQRLFMEEQEFYENPTRRQPLTTDEYVQAFGPLLSQVVCSSGTLRCIVRTIEAQHDIKEQP